MSSDVVTAIGMLNDRVHELDRTIYENSTGVWDKLNRELEVQAILVEVEGMKQANAWYLVTEKALEHTPESFEERANAIRALKVV